MSTRIVKYRYEKVIPAQKDKYTVALLHFDKDAVTDECGNTWTAYGSPTVSETNAKFGKALQLTTGKYLSMTGGITLGGQDFTIDGWSYVNSSTSGRYPTYFAASTALSIASGGSRLQLCNDGGANAMTFAYYSTFSTLGSRVLDTLHHWALVYQHDLKKIYLYINGTLHGSFALSAALPRTSYSYFTIGYETYNQGAQYAGSMDEFRVSDGIARWTENFTPPTEPYVIEVPEHSIYPVESIKFYDKPALKPNIALNGPSRTHTYAGLVPLTLMRQKTKTGGIDDYTVAMLHFDESKTKDELGNTWIDHNGTCSISSEHAKFSTALQLKYLNNYGSITLGGQDFTVDFWLYIASTNGTTGQNIDNSDTTTAFQLRIYQHSSPYANLIKLRRTRGSQKLSISKASVSEVQTTSDVIDRLMHIAIVYQYEQKTFTLFINGKKDTVLNDSDTLSRQNFPVGLYADTGGTIDEFRISDGIARWTGDSFTPPTEPYSEQVELLDEYEEVDNPLASRILVHTADGVFAIAKSKKSPDITLSASKVILTNKQLTQAVTCSTDSDAEITAWSSDENVATVSVSGNVITVTHGTKTGNATIFVRLPESREYEAATASFTAENYTYGALNETDQPSIRYVARADVADKIWSVGDVTSAISISKICIGRSDSSNYHYFSGDVYACILAFNHNKDLETGGKPSIHFAMMKELNTATNRIYDVNSAIVCTQEHENSNINGYTGLFHKNVSTNTPSNSGGWNSSYLKSTMLPRVLAAMPSEWTSVISSVTKYTDNTGKQSTAESAVTATTDTLFLLSEYEVFGSCTQSNTYEAAKQQRYQYYINGGSTICYNRGTNGTEKHWWLRSPRAADSTNYCRVNQSGVSNSRRANFCQGLVPCFVIA